MAYVTEVFGDGVLERIPAQRLWPTAAVVGQDSDPVRNPGQDRNPVLRPADAQRTIVVIGNAGHKRVALFHEALARQGLPTARLVTWHDLLSGRAHLARSVGPETLIRIEWLGQAFEAERLLLAAGAQTPETEDPAARCIAADEALHLPFDRGRLRYPRQWYRGLRATLRRWSAEITGQSGVRWMSHPDEIVTLFDKRQCHRLFADAGLPVPRSLGPVHSFCDLLARMRETQCSRVFVKLACGSSASGVVAFRAGGPRMEAITTVEMAP